MADTDGVPATATNAVDAAPKVFISHAGEDRERFAKPFAARLRANGVDAWASFWEINPGDSLVDKIFNEGLKSCETFVVVLSNNSIGKPWVREELNAGMVRRIEKGSKLIPIRLDGCEVPECLKHTCWQEIPDLANFDKEFERLLNAIFGMYSTPPIGERPAYVRPDVLKIGDLTRIDSVVFEAVCKSAISTDKDITNPYTLNSALAGQGISEQQIIETQEILKVRGFLKLHRLMAPPQVWPCEVTTFGFDQYVQAAIPAYGTICKDVALLLVRGECKERSVISERLNQPNRIITHVLESLQCNSLIKFSKLMSGPMIVTWISPELRRKLEEAN